MNETALELQRAIEKLHSCSATPREVVPVEEVFEGRIVWDGLVHIFDLSGHSEANRCYAWSSPIEGSSKRKFYAVLHIPPVDSPEKAVRASIIKDFRDSK